MFTNFSYMAMNWFSLQVYPSVIAGVVACGMTEELMTEILGSLLEILLAHRKRRMRRNKV